MGTPITNEDLAARLDTHAKDDRAAFGQCNESIGTLAREVAGCRSDVSELKTAIHERDKASDALLEKVLTAQLATQAAAEKISSAYTTDLARRASYTDEVEGERDKIEIERDKALVVVDVDQRKKRVDIEIEAAREQAKLDLEAKRIELDAKRERTSQINRLVGFGVAVLISIVTTYLITRGLTVSSPATETPAVKGASP